MSDNPATRASVGRDLTSSVHEALGKLGVKAPGLRVSVAGPRVVVTYRRRSKALPIDTRKQTDTEAAGMLVFATALELIKLNSLGTPQLDTGE